MKRSVILAAAGLFALATAAAAQPPAEAPAAAPAAGATASDPSAAKGAELFGMRCNGCHSGSGAAPAKADLAKHKPEEIVEILTNGAMAPMASGLSDDDKKAIAAFITAPAAPPAG